MGKIHAWMAMEQRARKVEGQRQRTTPLFSSTHPKSSSSFLLIFPKKTRVYLSGISKLDESERNEQSRSGEAGMRDADDLERVDADGDAGRRKYFTSSNIPSSPFSKEKKKNARGERIRKIILIHYHYTTEKNRRIPSTSFSGCIKPNRNEEGGSFEPKRPFSEQILYFGKFT